MMSKKKIRARINDTRSLIFTLVFFLVLLSLAYGNEQTTSDRPDREYQSKAGDIVLEGVKDSVDHWQLPHYAQVNKMRHALADYQRASGKQIEKLDYVVGITNSLEKVFPYPFWFKGKINDRVEIFAAKREYESFQVSVIPLSDKEINITEIKISDLKQVEGKENISSDNFKVYHVNYAHTAFASKPVSRIGLWPDPLVPFSSLKVKKDSLETIWVELFIPADSSAGTYKGEIILQANNSHSFKVFVSLKVWNFSLPEEQVVRTATWDSLDRLKLKYGNERLSEIYRKYCECFLEHKINPLKVGQHFFKDTDYSVVNSNIEFCLERGLKVFEIPPLKDEKLKKYVAHLRKKGWLKKTMIWVPGFDEPVPEEYQPFCRTSEEIRKVAPGLKIFMSGFPNPELYGAVDIWYSFLMTEDWRYNRECQRRGEEIWWCRCSSVKINEYQRPAYEYPSNVCIDTEAINYRIIYLMGFKYGVDGFSFWAGNYWPERKDDRAWLKWKPGDVWPCAVSPHPPPWAGMNNGDGYVVYPGEDGPLPSIRLKVMRDGIEDYEYLYILKNLLGEKTIKKQWGPEIKKALCLPPELIVSTRIYSKAPEDLLKYRQKVGILIDKISPSN